MPQRSIDPLRNLILIYITKKHMRYRLFCKNIVKNFVKICPIATIDNEDILSQKV